MSGLTDRATGDTAPAAPGIEAARQRWAESMQPTLDELRLHLARRDLREVASACGVEPIGSGLRLPYWGRAVEVAWPSLALGLPDGAPLDAFDAGMLLYYLRIADGTPPAGRWIAFRELPGGTFYHLAYQRYSGDRLARDFGGAPTSFRGAAAALGGEPLPEIGAEAFAFEPLPLLRLAALLWPGDDDFPARGAILFDASAHHYMTTDGLGLLGGGLAGRLARAAESPG